MNPAATLAHPIMIESTDRRSMAVALRREGKTYERIGRIMGISKQAAWSLVTEALKERGRRWPRTSIPSASWSWTDWTPSW